MSQIANVLIPITRASAGQDSQPESCSATATHTMVVLSELEENRIYSTPLFCFCVMETLLMAGSEARFVLLPQANM